jgi:ribonucleoside-diphosphate reductase alpha chain
VSFNKIKKRDGSTVNFDKTRIVNAINKASLSVDGEIDSVNLYDIVESVVENLEVLHVDTTPNVETIQDLIEQELMRAGYYQTVRSYIVYREEHKRLRQKSHDQQMKKLESSGLKVVYPDGIRRGFDSKKLTKSIKKFAQGLGDVDVKSVVDSVKTNLYDGITTEQIHEAIIMVARSFIERDPDYSKLASRLTLHKLYDQVIGDAIEKTFSDKYRETFIKNLKRGVKDGRLQKQILDFDLNALAKHIDDKRDDLFDYMGLQVLYDRYLLRAAGSDEIILETPQAFWMRVAMGLALNESKSTRTAWAKRFYDVMSKHHYVPSTPTLFHSGTTYPQLSSCYLNTVEDDLESIFKLYADNAQLSKYSGGIGTDYTPIRATGSLIKTTNVSSQGVIPFLKIANDVTVAINRSGKRRGATCAYLEIWHMDVEEFLELRKNTGDERRRTHDMDTAVWIPDLFMKRVQAGGMWTLFSPDETPDLHDLYGKNFEVRYEQYEKTAETGKIKNYKRIPALDLWRKTLTMLFETGHPWITFKDPCNLRSPQDHVGVVHNSNLCTEITLNTSSQETAVCNLGSVNLALHVKDKKLDHKKVKQTVSLAMRMLDNVVDLNYYPTNEARKSNLKHRPVGLGIMGYQDALYQLDIDFASEAAVEFADVSMELISYYAISGSANLARERGRYQSYKGSKWDRAIFPVDSLDILEAERGEKIDVSRARRLSWQPVYELVKKYGMRNSNIMAVAPTATISNIVGCYPCIEPIFKNLYVKANMSGDFTVINPYLVSDLKELNLWNEDMIKSLKFYDGSLERINGIPAHLREKYKEVFEISPDWLIRAAAHRAKWIDQSQSVNIFMRSTNGKILADVYSYAWRMGLKTTYYLRSMAASQVEKSTVDTAIFGDTHKRDFQLSDALSVDLSISNTNGADIYKKAEYAHSTASQETIKVCSILDPDCEACQ